MSLNKRSKGFAGVVSQGWEVTEAYGIEVEVEKLLKRPHRLSWPLGDSRSGWAEPPGELVLQRIPNDDDPSLRQVERDAARGVPREVDHTDCRPLRPHGEKHYRRKWTPEQGAAILNAAKGTLRDVAESLGIPYSSASIRRSWLLSRQGGGLTPETPAPEVNCLVQVSTS